MGCAALLQQSRDKTDNGQTRFGPRGNNDQPHSLPCPLGGWLPLGELAKKGSQKTNSFSGFELVDKSGNIRKPADYRDHYELLGTYTVLDPKGNQMHVTYASPGTAAYYRKAWKFPDGAALVKEVFGTDHAELTTGDAYWASGIQVWFVQIKDAKNRFPNNKLWGDGWGWALFKADAPDKQVANYVRTLPSQLRTENSTQDSNSAGGKRM